MALGEQLKKENEIARSVLGILNSVSDRIDSGAQVNPEDLADAVRVTEILVQRHHQEKEGDLLLYTMEGSPGHEHGALTLLLSEHGAIRKFFGEMKESAARYRAGDQAARSVVSEKMRFYSELFGQHLQTAERDLYGRVDIDLSRKEQDELAERFDRMDKSDVDRDIQLQNLVKLRRAYLK